MKEMTEIGFARVGKGRGRGGEKRHGEAMPPLGGIRSSVNEVERLRTQFGGGRVSSDFLRGVRMPYALTNLSFSIAFRGLEPTRGRSEGPSVEPGTSNISSCWRRTTPSAHGASSSACEASHDCRDPFIPRERRRGISAGRTPPILRKLTQIHANSPCVTEGFP